jgi:hypothetical protein
LFVLVPGQYTKSNLYLRGGFKWIVLYPQDFDFDQTRRGVASGVAMALAWRGDGAGVAWLVLVFI